MKIISICFSLIFLATNCFGFISRYHDPLDLRVVDQGETTRLVFEWIGDTNYSVESTNNTIMIRFNRAVPFNKNTIATKLPRRLHLEGVTNQNNQMVFTFLAYPNGQEFITTRHYKQGFKIVLDIVFENKANARPLIHTGTKNPNSTLKRLDRLEAPKIQPLQNLPKIRYMKKDNIQEIFVPLKTSLKPIIYQRGNFLWLVVDALQKWDLSALANNYTPKLFNQDKITALMLNSPNKIMPKIIYEKTGIKLVFNDAKQNDETQENLSLKVHSDPVIDSTIDIDLGNKATPISPIQFKDPVTADTLFLVPTPAHITSPQEQKFVDFRLLKTSAGLSLLPHSDDLEFKQNKNLLTIRRPHGLRLSPNPILSPEEEVKEAMPSIQKEFDKQVEKQFEQNPKPDIRATEAKAETETKIEPIIESTPAPVTLSENTNQNLFFDITKWYPSQDFLKQQQKLETEITTSDPPTPDSIYNLASFFLAHDLAPEAKNLLKSYKEKKPEEEISAPFQGLLGIANLFTENYEDAVKNFASEKLHQDPTIASWRWVAHFFSQDQKEGKIFETQPEINLDILPRYLRHAIYLRLLKSSLSADQYDKFDSNFQKIKQNLLSSQEKNYLDYLSAWYEFLQNRQLKALDIWKALAKSHDRFTSSRARYAINSKGVDIGLVSKADAIKDLENLKFAWRGDRFEYKVNQLLGNYLLDLGLYRRGLKTLKDLVTQFPNDPLNKEVTAKLTQEFSNIFIKDDIRAKFTPIDLILIYNAYKELSPLDKKSDLIQESLAKAYIELDLPDEAQKIMEHLVRFRSEADEKANRGFLLAQALEMDKKNDEALSILDASETINTKADLADKRTLLRISILREKEKYEEALKLLNDRNDIDSLRMKAELYADQKEWSKVAEIYDILSQTKKDQLTEKDIFYYMTSLVYSNNNKKLEEITKDYVKIMEKEPLKHAFALISSTLKPGVTPKIKEQLEDFLAKFKNFSAKFS